MVPPAIPLPQFADPASYAPLPGAEFLTAGEAGRMSAVHRYDFLDAQPDGAFDRVSGPRWGLCRVSSSRIPLWSLPQGTSSLLYTDGVVEQRGVDIMAGEEALRSALQSCLEAETGAVLAAIEAAMPRPPEGRDDDAAMLLLRVCG
jgi:stage II sporulation SpoE-like protein